MKADGQALRSATERLNDLLRQAQSGFVRMNLGVEALVTLRDGVYLAFAKSGGDWGLFIRHPACHEFRPLLEASRNDRIAAARVLGKLEEQLLQNARALAQDLAASIAEVESYLYPTLPASTEGEVKP